MYPGETPNPKIGLPSPGDHQLNLVSKQVTDRSAKAIPMESEAVQRRKPTA
jgi:hypothetical protein